MDRWTLPGPSSFLSEVTSALREGSNVVVGTPPNVAGQLTHAIDDNISNEWPLLRFAPPGPGDPIEEIQSQLECRDGAPSARTIASLLEVFVRKRVVIVPEVGVTRWTDWRSFIQEYASASRAINSFDRTQFIILASGVSKNRLPAKSPALHTVVWDDRVGEADIFAYVVHTWRSTGRRIDAKAKLMARIITRLALWDFDLVDYLLRLDWRDLFTPMEALAAIDPSTAPWSTVGVGWEEGGIAQFDGKLCVHSLALCRANDLKSELRMRLWAAQAAELLPALELRRRHIAERMINTKRIPSSAKLNGEIVRNIDDVEIGGLLHLARVYRMPPDIVNSAEKCRILRNKLAHLEPLTADEALEVI